VNDGDGAAPAPLPARPPRPLVVHWLVDAAIVFLVTVIVALFLGVSLWWVAGIALAVGLPLAPLTRNLEERGLAARRDQEP
jgi:hypothetical protein